MKKDEKPGINAKAQRRKGAKWLAGVLFFAPLRLCTFALKF
jgi:hypothetical protein